MKKRIKKGILITGLTTLVTPFSFVSCVNVDLNKDIEANKEKENNISQKQKEYNAQLETQILNNKNQIIQIQLQIQNNYEQVKTINKNIADAKSNLDSALNNLNETKTAYSTINEQYQNINKQLTDLLNKNLKTADDETQINNLKGQLSTLFPKLQEATQNYKLADQKYTYINNEIQDGENSILKINDENTSSTQTINQLQADIKKYESLIGTTPPEKTVVKNKDDNNDFIPSTDKIPQFDPSKINKDIFKELNKYPSYVDQYTTIPATEIYKEIYDRTFSLRYSFLEKSSGLNIKDNQGTAWLLDYHKNTNQNSIKLFLATNLHVLDHFSNALDNEALLKKLDYDDPSGNTVSGVELGKTQNDPTNFDPILQNQIKNQVVNRGGNVVFDPVYDYQTTPKNIDKPKIIFAGFDFMKDYVYDEFKAQGLDRLDAWYDREKQQYSNPDYVGADEELARIKSIKDYQGDRAIPFYRDFAVIEVTVDLDTAGPQLNQWVNKAIEAVDTYQKRITTQHLPNHTFGSSLPVPNYDIVSAGYKAGTNDPLYKTSLNNYQYVYIAGYPRDLDGNTIWVQNNPKERYDDLIQNYEYYKINNGLLFNVLTNQNETKVGTNNYSVYTSVWNKPMLEWYGYYEDVLFSTLYHGASGSVAYNQFGEIVGIYAVTSQSAKFDELMKSGARYAPLVQAYDIPGISHTNYAFNLIDATNTKQFPNQKTSYRQNLRLIYPNGFEDGSKDTAIFKNGF